MINEYISVDLTSLPNGLLNFHERYSFIFDHDHLDLRTIMNYHDMTGIEPVNCQATILSAPPKEFKINI